MVVIKRLEGEKYRVKYELKDLANIANVEHKLSEELIADMHGSGEKLREYLLPLIEEPIKLEYKDGRSEYTKLKRYAFSKLNFANSDCFRDLPMNLSRLDHLFTKDELLTIEKATFMFLVLVVLVLQRAYLLQGWDYEKFL